MSPADAPAARGFHHLAIQVRDLGAVERFYVETLGLAVLRRWPADVGVGAGERSVWLDTGNGAFLSAATCRARNCSWSDLDGSGGRWRRGPWRPGCA